MVSTLPRLFRTEHARYLEISLERLSTGYECLDSSRPWLVYWILNAASVLGVKFNDSLLNRVVDFLIKYVCDLIKSGNVYICLLLGVETGMVGLLAGLGRIHTSLQPMLR